MAENSLSFDPGPNQNIPLTQPIDHINHGPIQPELDPKAEWEAAVERVYGTLEPEIAELANNTAAVIGNDTRKFGAVAEKSFALLRDIEKVQRSRDRNPGDPEPTFTDEWPAYIVTKLAGDFTEIKIRLAEQILADPVLGKEFDNIGDIMTRSIVAGSINLRIVERARMLLSPPEEDSQVS